MNINTIDAINDAFFRDHNQRRFHLARSKETYDSISKHINLYPAKILALHRSWMSEMLIDCGHNVIFPNNIVAGQKFDLILAVDEMLTREDDEITQRKHIMQLLSLLAPQGVFLASLRDYRNSHCHRKPLGDSCLNILQGQKLATVEVNVPDDHDKQLWKQQLYVIKNDTEFSCLDIGSRRTLYFKQLAKYCLDAGITDFGVIKDVYWRSHLRRTPEHITWARAK